MITNRFDSLIESNISGDFNSFANEYRFKFYTKMKNIINLINSLYSVYKITFQDNEINIYYRFVNHNNLYSIIESYIRQIKLDELFNYEILCFVNIKSEKYWVSIKIKTNYIRIFQNLLSEQINKIQSLY